MSANSQRPIGGRRIASVALVALGLIVGTLLGPTFASAAEKVTQVFVTNTSSDPVPVALAPVTGDGGIRGANGGETVAIDPPVVASAISVTMNGGVVSFSLRYQGEIVAVWSGPPAGGHGNIDLALTRPITFDQIHCSGDPTIGLCRISWIGNEP